MIDKQPVKIILDTDMGGDCDDAGALGLLHSLADQHEAEILCVTSCTSLKNAPGAIDVINQYYGRGHIPVGSYNGDSFYEHPDAEKGYIQYLCQQYDTNYKQKNASPDAVALLRKTLSADKEGNIKIVAIGPLRVMRMLLDSGPDQISPLSGKELIEKKVSELVVMGGYFPEPGYEIFLGDMKLEAEFNIVGDIPSAQKVLNGWPTSISFCPYEIGYEILTGSEFIKNNPDSPVSIAYNIYCGGNRESWDLATVLYAVRGSGDYWNLSEYGSITIDQDGVSTWKNEKNGRHAYLMKKMDPTHIGNEMNRFISQKPTLHGK
jgi:inosine-uridine nucleoside N-ribohydrolase